MILSICVLGLMAIATASIAATATDSATVTASVASACSITSFPDIAFGAYDPTSATPKDATGSLSISCVKGTSYRSYLSTPRTMTGGTDTLNFEVYSDAVHSAAFPSSYASASSVTATSIAAVTTTLYGRIAAQQDVGVESYSGTLTATVEY